MSNLYSEFMLLDVGHRFQALTLFCILVILVIMVFILTIVKKAKDKK